MQRKLVLEFTKMNGTGNDFIVVDNRFYYFSDEELSELAARLCPRRTGIGADGLLAFKPADDEMRHQYRMKYYNADGSLGTMCGNGARCLARFARFAGVDAQELAFESDAGVYRAHAPDAPAAPIRLFVLPPQRFQARIELASQPDADLGPVHYIWTGTEHVVVFVEDVDTAPVAAWGPKLRKDSVLAPAGANVNFVQVLAPGAEREPARLAVRTFEKGVEEETLACGTGAMASAVIARLTGEIEAERVHVQMRGGVLRVGFALDGGEVTDLYLEGAVETVYRGTVEV
jgi:diaminopimelate epimerase